ncbi:MAG: LXG domain-containing protein, partial [Streptococcaceae bacterium]|nr:LXG domain-containing protein [Streptococcaceae bacterium]MCL2681193.1 LXG domain-containing protein [Streptococcaceae bacterium]
MPIGQRKISTSDITLSTAPQTVVESNNAEFNGLSDELTKFMQEGQLSGKGWESAKKLAGVYETITHTFQMVSDQLMQANAEVKNTSGLIGTQIDEAAIEDQISSNKAAMTTLSYSNTIWNSTNPGVANQDTSMATANNNYYITSLTNQNNELQKVIDGLNGYDSRTKSVYDEVLDSLNKLESLMKQVSDSSKTYNAKTGLFTTDGIDMKIVSSLDDTYNNFEGYKTLAKDLGISE